jgi:hypothetical protein
MGEAGRRRVETQFDLRVTVEQTTDLMARLVHDARSLSTVAAMSDAGHRSRARKSG